MAGGQQLPEQYTVPQLARVFHSLPHLNVSLHSVNNTFNPHSEIYLEVSANLSPLLFLKFYSKSFGSSTRNETLIGILSYLVNSSTIKSNARIVSTPPVSFGWVSGINGVSRGYRIAISMHRLCSLVTAVYESNPGSIPFWPTYREHSRRFQAKCSSMLSPSQRNERFFGNAPWTEHSSR